MKQKTWHIGIMTVAAIILFGLTGYVGATEWQIETVTNINPGTSSIPCLQVEDNKAYISFYDESDKALKLATNTSGSWVVTTIPGTSGTVADTNTKLDTDDNGNFYIGYQGANGDLMLATNNTGTWATSVVDAGVWPGDIALGVPGNNWVIMGYFNLINHDIMIASNESGSWVKTVILDGSLTGQLPYYALSGDGYGSDSSIKVFISYYDDAPPDSIRYVTDESGIWQSYLVDTIGMAAGWRTSLRLDDTHAIHLTYYDWANDQLKYATNASGAWVKTVLSSSGETNVWDHDMKVDNNKVYVSYMSGGLKFTSNMRGSWQTEVVEAGGTQGRSSIYIDNGLPHISYLNYIGSGGGYDLKYARMSGFTDVPSTHWAFDYVMAIYNNHITTGCAQNPLRYCPDTSVSRDQMAAFIVRAKEGEPSATYCSTGSPFSDVDANHWACKYIKRLYELGITTGCAQSPLRYCPDTLVSRDQMAAFIVRAKEGEPAANYCASGSPFSDVDANHWACKYIKRLYELGITTGCAQNPLRYCPNNIVSRDQMAAFLARGFLGMQ